MTSPNFRPKESLSPPNAPSLPIPGDLYQRGYHEQLNNALRIYFNEIDNDFGGLLQPNGGRFLSFPHIAASDSTDQYADGNNDPTVVKWNTLDAGSGFILNAPGSATAEYSGVYKITYSAQLVNTVTNASHEAVFWLKIDSGSGFVDVPNSATQFTIPAAKNNNTPSYVCGYSEVTFQVNGGDVVELWWATDLAYNPTGPVQGVYIFHDAAQTTPYVRPAIPSVIGSITFVSKLTT